MQRTGCAPGASTRSLSAEDCALASHNCEPEDDAAFLEKIVALHASGAQKGAKQGAKAQAKAAPARLSPEQLQLHAGNVAKVVRDGVTHLEFLPATAACALAVADKKGYVRFTVSCSPDCTKTRRGAAVCLRAQRKLSGRADLAGGWRSARVKDTLPLVHSHSWGPLMGAAHRLPAAGWPVGA